MKQETKDKRFLEKMNKIQDNKRMIQECKNCKEFDTIQCKECKNKKAYNFLIYGLTYHYTGK